MWINSTSSADIEFTILQKLILIASSYTYVSAEPKRQCQWSIGKSVSPEVLLSALHTAAQRAQKSDNIIIID